jgi:hypothetical protein
MLVEIIFSVCSIALVWFLFSNSIIYLFRRLKKNNVYRRDSERKPLAMYVHIKRLYFTVYHKDDNKSIVGFFVITISVFVLSLTLMIYRLNIINALFYSILFGLSPYLFLQVKLRKKRVDSSYESDVVINELINQYKINNFNIISALDAFTVQIKNAPNMQKNVFYLSLKLKQYRDEEELNTILQDFVYSVKTEWIKLLSNNIFIGLVDNTNILNGLEDIQSDIQQAIRDNENEKRLNSESFTLIKFVAPLLYVGSIYCAKAVFKMPLSDFFKYQFNTQTGFNYFIFMVLIFLMDSLILILIKNKKFDI